MPIPVTIISGFLGAGKTTLLNRILRGEHGLRVAVLVNDFGAINIDAELIVGVEDDMISLSNGCICCSIRDDLARAARDLLAREYPPEYLVIETSGVSDPRAVAYTFDAPDMRTMFEIDGMITLVDAEQVGAQPSYDRLIHDQLEAADIVVLNKIDLVTRQELDVVRIWIEELVPGARVIETSMADVALEILVGVGRSRRAPAGWDCMEAQDHHAAFATWSYETDQPMLLRAVQQTLSELSKTVLRAKGIVYLADLPEGRAVVQMVGRRITITPGAPWNGEEPRTRLVLIGRPGEVGEADLQRAFEQCRASARNHDPHTTVWNVIRAM